MPNNAPTPTAPPVTPPVSSTPPGTPAGAPTPWRAPATAGKFAGKSAEEVLGIAQAAYEIIESGAVREPAASPAPTPVDIADDEYVSGAQLKRLLEERNRPDTSALELAASANINFVRQRHATDFAKYGSEIDALIARVPANLRTVDNLERCVKMVRSDHLDEIAHERAQQLVTEMAPTLRSNGGAAPPAPVTREHSLESEKIPQEWKDRARAAKITEDVVAEFCRANGMAPADFYKQFDTPMNRIVEDVSQKRHMA